MPSKSPTSCRIHRQLGCIGYIIGLACRGAGEIKLHPWFNGLDWTSLARQKAAFIPHVTSELDTSYFHPKTVSTRYRYLWRSQYILLKATSDASPSEQQADISCHYA